MTPLKPAFGSHSSEEQRLELIGLSHRFVELERIRLRSTGFVGRMVRQDVKDLRPPAHRLKTPRKATYTAILFELTGGLSTGARERLNSAAAGRIAQLGERQLDKLEVTGS